MEKIKEIFRGENYYNLNNLDESKFPLLTNKIAQSLSVGNPEPFSKPEITKLQASLNLNETDVKNSIQTIIDILNTLAYYRTSPRLLKNALSPLNLEEEKTLGFLKAWESFGEEIIAHLQKVSMFPKIQYISYHVGVETSSSELAEMKEVKGLLNLGISSDLEPIEKLEIEFTQSELTDFYHKMEQISLQLDDLRNS